MSTHAKAVNVEDVYDTEVMIGEDPTDPTMVVVIVDGHGAAFDPADPVSRHNLEQLRDQLDRILA